MALNEVPSALRLRDWHDRTASRVHIAGMKGDWETIETLERAFAECGLEVERHEFWAYLSRPIDASVRIIGAKRDGSDLELPLRENPMPGDPYNDPGEVPFAFNAYSGSGDSTGRVVYANYGRLEDFETLDSLGVDFEGAVVIARYGGNYRGFKAKFAEERGAAAVLIFIDPADGGYTRGLMYPEGGWQTDSCIQRGSIKTLPYPGDPLTPGVEATEQAERLDAGTVDLPRIPVQPIGWAAAREIMMRMSGEAVPKGWQGGLPLAYRVEGGDGLRVRVKVEQERRLVRTANVIGRLEGAVEPEKLVIVGCHHDAWGYGASDAMAGMISLLESARSFGELAQRGQRPRRTVLFCAWGAEEHGIIGSTEWVEANRDELVEHGVGYINLDMASMGPDFNASATPDMKRLIVDASMGVPQARDPDRSVYDAWAERVGGTESGAEPPIGLLGGGSDHIAFNCYIGMACTYMSGGGSPGTAYHTARDTLHWYRKVVGEDYEPALMIARMTNAVAARLANDEELPLRPERSLVDLRRHLERFANDSSPHARDVAQLDARAQRVSERLSRDLRRASGASLNRWRLDAMRAWTSEDGLPGRPWFKGLFVATDPASGYGAWALPGLRATEDDADAFGRELARVGRVLDWYERGVSGSAE